MKKLIAVVILAVLVAVMPLAAWADQGFTMQSTVFVRNGVLYAYDLFDSDNIQLYIPPSVNIYGQKLVSTFDTAIFTPVITNGGDFNLKSGDKGFSMGLLVVGLSGRGDVIAYVGGRKEVIYVNNQVSEKPVIKFPDFTIDYTLPYSLSATGNIRLKKMSSGESKLAVGNTIYQHHDVWNYQNGGLLDGTMRLSYQFPSGGSSGPTFGFPFCPASAQAWLNKIKQAPPEPTPPRQQQPVKPIHSSNLPAEAAGAAVLAAAALTRKKWLPLLPPLRVVYVSLALREAAPGTVNVTYEPRRGPKQVTAQLRTGAGTVAGTVTEVTLAKGETKTVILPPGLTGTITVIVPRYKNLAKGKSVTVGPAN